MGEALKEDSKELDELDANIGALLGVGEIVTKNATKINSYCQYEGKRRRLNMWREELKVKENKVKNEPDEFMKEILQADVDSFQRNMITKTEEDIKALEVACPDLLRDYDYVFNQVKSRFEALPHKVKDDLDCKSIPVCVKSWMLLTLLV